MTLPTINSFTIKESKTQSLIPVLNDVHLHSVYNPEREAKAFVGKHLNELKDKNTLLLLGLGFGYHLEEIINTMEPFHGENYKIFVIEPCQELFDKLPIKALKKNPNISFIVGESSESIFSKYNVIDFFIKKPTVLLHPASFNLFSKYYKSILGYKASSNISEILNTTKSKQLQDYLLEVSKTIHSTNQLPEYISNKKNLNQEDFMFLALDEMTKHSFLLNGESK